MKLQTRVTTADAMEARRLIQEYLLEGGTGFDADALERVADALAEADRIVISDVPCEDDELCEELLYCNACGHYGHERNSLACPFS